MNGPTGSRKCHVIKKESEEFEFYLSVDDKRKGQIITSVTKDGPAYRAGLKDGDRVIGINGNNVEQKDHNQIVEIIRECIPTNEIDFLVIDAEHDAMLKRANDNGGANADPRPRLCKIKKKNNSFGFFLEAGKDSGHFIKKVTKGGAADGTGLRDGDRVIAVNKTKVEKLSHKQIVEMIKKSGNKVALLVIDEDGYQILKKRNVSITEKMAKGGSTSSRSSSSSTSKQQSTKSPPAKVNKASTKQTVKSPDHKDKGKVRVVHVLKHPEKGYGFYLRSKKASAGEFIGDVDNNGPAAHSGLQNDDRVMAVNGKSIEGMAHGDVIGLIKKKKAQVVLVVMDDVARKHFEEKDDYPSSDDIVRSQNYKIRIVKLTRGEGGYGMFMKMEKGSPFHTFVDVEKGGVADEAGITDGEVLIAVEGSSVLADSHEDCVKKIKAAGNSVEMIVGSRATSDFLLKVGVAIDGNLAQEWPTEEELSVPTFGKTPKPKEEKLTEAPKAAAVAATVVEEVKKENDGLGMKPRLCRVVREGAGFGFFLKDDKGHYLTNIEPGSPAFKAGVLDYDRIVEINGENAEKYTHAEVVNKIRGSGNEVTFLVVNKEEDKFFKEKGIAITAALLNTSDDLADEHKPRVCKLVRTANGYGFHLKGEPGREGQFAKEIAKGGAADEAGLREGDRIIEVNDTNVIGQSHDFVVKKITEKKEEVTFLVIDKEGEAYYKLRSIKIVAALAVAKEVSEEREEEERESIGHASATSSVIEATVHQEPEEVEIEVGEGPLETVEAAAAVAAVAEVIEEHKEEVVEIESVQDDEEKAEEMQEKVEEVVEEIKDVIEDNMSEEDQERLDDAVETLVAAAAVAEVIDDIQDRRQEDDDSPEIPEKAPEPVEILEEAVVGNVIEELIEERKDDDMEVPEQVAEIVEEIRDSEAEENASDHSRPVTPEPEPEPTEIIPQETRKEIAEVIENHIEEKKKEEEEDDVKRAQKVAAALVMKEFVEKVSDKDGDSDKEEEIIVEETREPELEPTPAPVIAAVIKSPTPPRSPSPEPPKPIIVVVTKPAVQETPRPPPAAVLTETGEIVKAKPTPEPDNEPKVPWARFQLKPVNRTITIGAVTSAAVKKEEAPTSDAPTTLSSVAVLKAAIERRNREAQQSSARKDVKDELAEISKIRSGANQHIEKFGGSTKKPQENGPTGKKNPWVGEGMKITIIET